MLEKMKEIIAEQLNVDEEAITEATSFKEDLGADSLDLFELVMALEEEFDVEIPSEDLEDLTTVGAVMEYLKGKVSVADEVKGRHISMLRDVEQFIHHFFTQDM